MFISQVEQQETWKFPCSFHRQSAKEHGNFHIPLTGTMQRNMEIPLFLSKAERKGTWECHVSFTGRAQRNMKFPFSFHRQNEEKRKKLIVPLAGHVPLTDRTERNMEISPFLSKAEGKGNGNSMFLSKPEHIIRIGHY